MFPLDSEYFILKKIMFSLMNLEDRITLIFVFVFETRMYYNMGMMKIIFFGSLRISQRTTIKK